MRRLAPLAALLLAPALARPSALAAQSPGEARTFAGCDMYACALVTVGELYAGGGTYRVSMDGTLTLRQAVLSGPFDTIARMGLYTNVFGTTIPGQCEDASYAYPTYISLVGATAGDVTQIFSGGCVRTDFAPITTAEFGGQLLVGGPNALPSGFGIGIEMVTTPEPATLALTLGELAVLGAGARKRRRG